MNALILGGASLRHKEWVRKVARELQPMFEQVVFIDYRHWETGGETDAVYELNQIEAAAHALGTEYVIIAKSVGTALAMLGVAHGRLAPKRCVFLGISLLLLRGAWETADDLIPLTRGISVEDALRSLPPTVVVQNEHDPHGSAEEVKKLVAQSGNERIQVRATPGDTHDYVDFALIRQLATAGH